MGQKDREWKEVRLSDFLTEKQIEQAWKLYEEHGTNVSTFTKLAEERVIRPNKNVIEMKLDREIDCRYLAYCVLMIFDAAVRQAREEGGNGNYQNN